MKPSEYVSRCCDALDEYMRLRWLGVSHEGAQQQSGLLEAVTGKQARVQVDVKQAAAGRDE